MSSAAVLQTQISAIMDVLVKAAVAEISQLLEEDAAALHHEIRRRNEEIQELKTRLLLTETELQRLTADRCTVGVQVEITDTGVTARALVAQAEDDSQEALAPKDKPQLPQAMEVNPHPLKREEPVTPEPNAEEEELSGLEFQMKIEQVEELVDQKLNQAEQKREAQNRRYGGNSHSWCSEKEYEDQSLIELQERSRSFPDPYVMMDDPMTCSSSGLFPACAGLENQRHDEVDCDSNLQPQDSHRHVTDSVPFSRISSSHPSSHLSQTVYVGDPPRLQMGPKPFRCEECGKGFTQRTRLMTHRRVHTGEKPFRCQLCGKMFSRQDNCLRHMRLHSGQRW